ncbi:hypothetical protein BH11PSE2_BH11PSE2_08790 [soil metagenome]
MAGACPVPGADDPLVKGLLGVVDCNVQTLVHGGYSALFAPSSPFSILLTVLLTLFVAIQGYRLMLGQAQLRVNDLVLNMVKLGTVLALSTQWETYQLVVYNFLFHGPAQLANAMVGASQSPSSALQGDIYDRLQQAFDALTSFAAAYAQNSPIQASPLTGGSGFGALALTASASLLLLTSVGVVLAAKIVLGILLAAGPLFIALLLFDSTRGLFEGWLRAALAFAIAPLVAILLLGVSLTMLEPALVQLAVIQAEGVFSLGPVYAVLTLVLVFVGVTAGGLFAAVTIAKGLHLPKPRRAQPQSDTAQPPIDVVAPVIDQPRAQRIAAAAAAMERRDASILVGPSSSDRRSEMTVNTSTGPERRVRPEPVEVRLGQTQRRNAAPRRLRAAGRNAR